MKTRRAIPCFVCALALTFIAACGSDITGPGPVELGPLVNGVRTGGRVSLLVIPALFAESSPSPFSHIDLQRRYFDGPSEPGTLTQYYAEASRQRFYLRGTVVPWVRTSVRSNESGQGVEGVSREADHVIEALRAVDATVNFGQYDNDGADGRPNSGDDDGIVDGGVMLVTAEPGRPCGPQGAVWPHVSPLQLRSPTAGMFRVADATPSGTNIGVKAYAIVPAVTCTPGMLTGIGVAAHELMHLFFRMPDMYGIGALSETQLNGARFWRTGCWDVMAAGSGWGCGTGSSQDFLTPTHANPWVREMVHWLRSDTIGTVTDTTITLSAIAAGGRTARFLIKPGEYFEIEYRQKTGYDRGIPASGVLIYHVKLDRGVTPPTCVAFCTQPPLLIEADNNNGLLRTLDEGGNRGEAGDAFGILGRSLFSAVTSPAAVAADGSPTSLDIKSITIDEAAKVARIRLSH
jgi:immune inhibitor A